MTAQQKKSDNAIHTYTESVNLWYSVYGIPHTVLKSPTTVELKLNGMPARRDRNIKVSFDRHTVPVHRVSTTQHYPYERYPYERYGTYVYLLSSQMPVPVTSR